MYDNGNLPDMLDPFCLNMFEFLLCWTIACVAGVLRDKKIQKVELGSYYTVTVRYYCNLLIFTVVIRC